MDRPLKRGRGRPPVPPEERRSEALLLRLRPEEMEAIRAAADEAGLPVAEYVRRRALRRRVR